MSAVRASPDLVRWRRGPPSEKLADAAATEQPFDTPFEGSLEFPKERASGSFQDLAGSSRFGVIRPNRVEEEAVDRRDQGEGFGTAARGRVALRQAGVELPQKCDRPVPTRYTL